MTKAQYSFIRPIPAQRVVRLACHPVDVELDLARSALIVIDMQNDFCHPEGWFGARGIPTDAARALCPGLNGLTRALRATGAPVIWLNWGLRADLAELPHAIISRGGGFDGSPTYGDSSPTENGRILVQGDWGAQLLDELETAPGDLQVYKSRLGGFHNTALDAILRKLQVTTLFFAGVNTDRCVFSTLQDAGFLGFDCVLLTDLTATSSSQTISDSVTEIITRLHGVTSLGSELVAAVSALAPLQVPSNSQDKTVQT